MAIRLQRASRVRRQMLRRLPRRFRPAPKLAIAALTVLLATAAVLAGVRLSAPDVPVLPAGPLFAMDGLERRPVQLVAPGFWLYPDLLPAQEGWLSVPGDHRRPGAASLRVHFTRLQAQVPEPAADAPQPAPQPDPRSAPPIVYLADSASGSATSALLGADFAAFQALRTLGPVLAFDTRDSAHADPALYCPGRWSLATDAPLSAAMLDSGLAADVQRCAEALQHAFEGVRFGPAQSVADLEALRSALDIDRMRLLAAGDGARLALDYMAAHPQRVERAVLLGAQLPRRPAPRPQHVERALARALSALHADPVWSRRLPEPHESLRVAIARLNVQPVQQTVRDPLTGGSVEVVLGGGDLRLAVLEHLTRRDGLHHLARLLEQVFDQRYTLLAHTALALRRTPPPRAALLARRCALSEDPALARHQRMTAAFTLLGDAADLLRQAHCASWPEPRPQPDWNAPPLAPPVLLVAGAFDPLAPVEQIEELAEALGGARVLHAATSTPAAQLHWALALAPRAGAAADLHAFLSAPTSPVATESVAQQPSSQPASEAAPAALGEVAAAAALAPSHSAPAPR